jgi:uncharacterized protein (TIGR00369 family)
VSELEASRIAERVSHWNGRPLFAWAGLRIVEAHGGHAVLELDVQDHHRGGGGSEAVNGAIAAYGFDCALGTASASTWDEGVRAQVTVTMNVNYLRMARAERSLKLTAEVTARGRSLVFVAGELLDEDGETCATATGTYRLFHEQ